MQDLISENHDLCEEIQGRREIKIHLLARIKELEECEQDPAVPKEIEHLKIEIKQFQTGKENLRFRVEEIVRVVKEMNPNA